jgi:hypothetical protein
MIIKIIDEKDKVVYRCDICLKEFSITSTWEINFVILEMINHNLEGCK